MLVGIALILIGVFAVLPKAVGITLIVFGSLLCVSRLFSISIEVVTKSKLGD